MDLNLDGRVALITGASEGIGKATALSLAREGCRVGMCARRPDVLNAAAEEVRAATGAEVLALPTDVTRPDDIARAVETIGKEFGPVYILVNNAGQSAAAPFDVVGDDVWAADLDLKLMAAVRTSRLVIPMMRGDGGGRIVNVVNIGAKQPGPSSLPTSVSRAAGIALTKAMSKDLARYNILVNAVCIGLIKSAQMERGALRRFPDLPLDDAWKKMGENVPLGRVGEAREAADLITYLCSDRASYITGVAINMDGGTSGAV